MRSAALTLWCLLAVAAAGAGCATSSSSVVRTLDTRPSIAVVGAPAGTWVYVDGKNAGAAALYDGQPFQGTPRVLLVEPGTHDVEIVDAAGRVLFKQRVFVESETKTLQVH